MALLELRKIAKNYGDKEIIRDISFSLDKGKTLSIIGSSGSGKTTLLRCISFLEIADEGEIILNGETIFTGDGRQKLREEELRDKRKHFSLVFQQFNLFPQYTALENVMLSKKLQGIDNRQEAEELLIRMELKERMDYYPHQLSGGQQQRVAIARALAVHPDVLCFDEPTSALDPQLTMEVLKVIRELARNNTTMIIVTHEIGFAAQISDEIIYMDEGIIVEKGPADRLISEPQDERTKAFLNSIVRY